MPGTYEIPHRCGRYSKALRIHKAYSRAIGRHRKAEAVRGSYIRQVILPVVAGGLILGSQRPAGRLAAQVDPTPRYKINSFLRIGISALFQSARERYDS